LTPYLSLYGRAVFRRFLVVTIFVLAGCGSHNNMMTGDDDQVSDGAIDSPTHPGDGSGSGGGHPTIFTILLENHDYKEIVGSSNAPYINSLIAKYALATNYKDTGHPSTPNYLNLISGNNQYPGVIDVLPTAPPYFPSSAQNLATQLEAAGIPWRSYQDGETKACDLANDGNYAPRHDPFLYFSDQQTGPNGICASTNVDYTNFATDLAAGTYHYMWISPNLIDDGHNPSGDPVGALTASDTWLSNNVPAILASDAFTSGGVLFITWDEAEGRNGDDPDLIPMIVISPRVKTAGMTSATAYTHSSYLATVEDLLGLARLATVTSTPSMTEFLNP
jgi:phosphatidylinositol-3-phosphatase